MYFSVVAAATGEPSPSEPLGLGIKAYAGVGGGFEEGKMALGRHRPSSVIISGSASQGGVAQPGAETSEIGPV